MAIDLKTTQVGEDNATKDGRTSQIDQPLQEILARVGRDSRDASRKYLDETVVPHGGE